jgi:saccharopine dehydrogenase-like NADP-dependent oxidoreductase
MKTYKILILGGYGNFGKRIAEGLAHHSNALILIAGRDEKKAEQLCRMLNGKKSGAQFKATKIDVTTHHFEKNLAALSPNLVIHTAGPFQGQDYKVPHACIKAGCHYIDLADDRRFVCDIASLNDEAQRMGVVVVSGASSVPGLSSAVIDHYAPDFSQIHSIDCAIAPGNKAERGEATVRGILAYTGHPIKIWRNKNWETVFGWMSPRKINFGGIGGRRWLANVDIPDLELFPVRYKTASTVIFQAGLELPFLHLIMVFMAFLAKKRLVKNWSTLTKPIICLSRLFANMGSSNGGMRIEIKGTDHAGQRTTQVWSLFAPNGIGPYIPTMSTLILAEKLIAGDVSASGARACLGMYSLAEFDQHITEYGIFYTAELSHG